MHPMLGRFLLSRGSDVLAKVLTDPPWSYPCISTLALVTLVTWQ